MPLGDVDIRLTSVDEANTLTATHPLSLVLGVFGAIAAVVGTVLSCQALSRSIRSTRERHASGRRVWRVESRHRLAFTAGFRSGRDMRCHPRGHRCDSSVAIDAHRTCAPSRSRSRPQYRLHCCRDRWTGNDRCLDRVQCLGGVARHATSRPTRDSRCNHEANRRTHSGTRLSPPAATGVRFALGDRNRVAARSAIISAVAATGGRRSSCHVRGQFVAPRESAGSVRLEFRRSSRLRRRLRQPRRSPGPRNLGQGCCSRDMVRRVLRRRCRWRRRRPVDRNEAR